MNSARAVGERVIPGDTLNTGATCSIEATYRRSPTQAGVPPSPNDRFRPDRGRRGRRTTILTTIRKEQQGDSIFNRH